MKNNEENNFVFLLADVTTPNLSTLSYDGRTIVFNDPNEASNYLDTFTYLKEKPLEIIATNTNRLEKMDCINYNNLIKDENWIKEKERQELFLSEVED